VGGIDELKDAIIAKLKNDNGIDYAREEIIVSCGAKHSLYKCPGALRTGRRGAIPSPYWVSYPDQVLLSDAVPVFVHTTEADSFMLKTELLDQKSRRRQRLLY